MNPPPRLRLAPRPSRIGAAAIIAACTLTSILLASLPLPMEALGAGAVLIVAVLRFRPAALRGPRRAGVARRRRRPADRGDRPHRPFARRVRSTTTPTWARA